MKARILTLIVMLATIAGFLQIRRQPEQLAAIELPAASKAVDGPAIRPQVESFCGSCHATPPAESFPKAAWPFEVSRGFDFYFESFRQDLQIPSKEDVIAYYQSQAPTGLRVSPPPASPPNSKQIEFRVSATLPSPGEPPAVSFITSRTLRQDDPPSLLFSDMRSGELRALPLGKPMTESQLLTTCANPAHVEPCDLDGDGQQELVIAELGSTQSGDHIRGAVIWLRRQGNQWKQRLLLSGVGRVADVQPADFDGDGDQDLLVAEFGHFRTGRILLLENMSVMAGIPQFREQVLDTRHGTIHVPVADLNADGHLDFVAVVSQEYEVVDAFLNKGDGTFQRERIFDGKDPAFGSSGIQIVDLDSDGDLDVLYSNGDTFGSEHLKPYHGVRWLENRGKFPFEDHLLTNMVGVQKALAADLDADGDRDIVAVALMPKNLLVSPELKDHDSIVWLEQTEPRTFVRHGLEREKFYHAGLDLTDFDQDGDVDIVVGNMYPDDSPAQPWMSLWSNSPTERKR